VDLVVLRQEVRDPVDVRFPGFGIEDERVIVAAAGQQVAAEAPLEDVLPGGARELVLSPRAEKMKSQT
jgi:hypothetical protein